MRSSLPVETEDHLLAAEDDQNVAGFDHVVRTRMKGLGFNSRATSVTNTIASGAGYDERQEKHLACRISGAPC